MKSYIEQIYNEGLATTFYLKPVKFIRKYIKNDNLFKIIKILIAVLYTVFALIFAWLMFWEKYPL